MFKKKCCLWVIFFFFLLLLLYICVPLKGVLTSEFQNWCMYVQVIEYTFSIRQVSVKEKALWKCLSIGYKSKPLLWVLAWKLASSCWWVKPGSISVGYRGSTAKFPSWPRLGEAAPADPHRSHQNMPATSGDENEKAGHATRGCFAAIWFCAIFLGEPRRGDWFVLLGVHWVFVSWAKGPCYRKIEVLQMWVGTQVRSPAQVYSTW